MVLHIEVVVAPGCESTNGTQYRQHWGAAQHKRNVPFALVIYGSPYLLNRLPAAIALSDAVIVAYQDDSRTLEYEC